MSRLVCAMLLVAALAATAGHSGEGTSPPEDPGHYRPAYFPWLEYQEERGNGYYKEWNERLFSLLQRPEGIREALHVYGWGIGTVINVGYLSIPLFNRNIREMSLFVFDGKLIFNQPDGSLTLMELATGKVLGRTRRYFEEYGRAQPKRKAIRAIYPESWRQYEKILKGSRLLIDSDTGEIVDEFSRAMVAPHFKMVYSSYGNNLEHKLTLLDYDTKEKTVLMEQGRGAFSVGGDRIFSRTTIDSASKLMCFSLMDGKELWTVPLPDNEYHPAIVYQDDIVYVFGQPYESEQCTHILAFDMQGRLVETILATPELFGGEMPDTYFHKNFLFKGVQYEGNAGDFDFFLTNERIGLWNFVKAIRKTHDLTVYPQAASELPEDGFAWIECAPADAVPKLHYRDKTHAWSGTIRAVDKLMALEATRGGSIYFAVAGDENHIVYLSHSGRLECLDRFTGQSRWIYVFPMLFIDNSKGGSWSGGERFTMARQFQTKQFFTDRAKYCDEELNTQGILPFLVDGAGEPAQPTVIVDPSPDTGHKEDVLPSAIAAWSLSLALAAALAVIWKSGMRRLYKSLAYILIIIAVVAVAIFFGGYSWFTFTLLRIDFWAGVFLFLFPLAWPTLREWCKRSVY